MDPTATQRIILQSEQSGAAAQGFGEAIPKHTVAP